MSLVGRLLSSVRVVRRKTSSDCDDREGFRALYARAFEARNPSRNRTHHGRVITCAQSVANQPTVQDIHNTPCILPFYTSMTKTLTSSPAQRVCRCMCHLPVQLHMVLPQAPLPSLWRCRVRSSPHQDRPSRPERPLQPRRHREQSLRRLLPRMAHHQEASPLSYLQPRQLHDQLLLKWHCEAGHAHPPAHQERPQHVRWQHGTL